MEHGPPTAIATFQDALDSILHERLSDPITSICNDTYIRTLLCFDIPASVSLIDRAIEQYRPLTQLGCEVPGLRDYLDGIKDKIRFKPRRREGKHGEYMAYKAIESEELESFYGDNLLHIYDNKLSDDLINILDNKFNLRGLIGRDFNNHFKLDLRSIFGSLFHLELLDQVEDDVYEPPKTHTCISKRDFILLSSEQFHRVHIHAHRASILAFDKAYSALSALLVPLAIYYKMQAHEEHVNRFKPVLKELLTAVPVVEETSRAQVDHQDFP